MTRARRVRGVRVPGGSGQILDAAVRRGWLPARAAGVLRVAGVPVVAVGVLLWLAATVLRAGGAAPAQAYAEFVDPSTGSYLDVQLDDTLSSYGTFSAVVPGQGRVWPVPKARADATRSGDTVELSYDGPGLSDPQVVPGVPYDPPRTAPPPQEVRLRLVARLDPVRHTATVDVQVDRDRHRIQASAQPANAPAVVDEFLAAIRAADWDRVYSLESAAMRNGSKRQDMVVGLQNAGAITTVSAARATGPTVYSTKAGASYARTPVHLTYGSGPDATSVDATLVLALTGGSWNVLAVE